MTNALTVTPQDALAILQQQNTPEAKAIVDYVNAIKQKNIAVLGESECFVLTDASGQIRAFKSSLTFSIKNGGLWNIDGKLVISAQGYEKWATAVGASVIFPKKIQVGNELCPNPRPTYTEDGRIVDVLVRAIAFCYSPLGIPQVSDWTHSYNPPSYKMVDLFAKAKKYPQSFKLLPKGMEPDKKEDETWALYPFDEAVVFWVNTTHKEAFDWYSQSKKREQKALDIAQTFVKRNALKHLCALQKAPYDNWTIPIMAWRPTGNNIIKWDGTKYSELQDKITQMIEGGSQDFQGQQIEYNKGHIDGSDEEFQEEVEAETDIEDSPESTENRTSIAIKTKGEKPEEQNKNLAELSKDVRQAVFLSEKFPEIFKEARLLLKIKKPAAEFSDDEAIKVCRKVSELLDAQN